LVAFSLQLDRQKFAALAIPHQITNGICTLSRKMTSFRQSENMIVL